jgi:Ca-activated chloride channel family protein
MPAIEEVVGFAPRQAATGQEIRLAMQSLWLTGRILPVGARLLVRHAFRSQEDQPVEVIYAFALPRDAALRRFRVVGEGFSVRSELKPVQEAVRAYEEGLEAGHLATLARSYRDGIVNLTLGNLRPGETVTVLLELLCGVELHDDGLRFRFPFTLAPCYHAAARAVQAEPGLGEMELPEEEFGDVILPRWAADAAGLHAVGFRLAVETAVEAASVGSPSHAIQVAVENGRSRVTLAPERDVPNRDLVLDVRTREAYCGVLSGLCRQGKGQFAAVIPSARFGARREAPRRIVFLLDRSGSMSGPPIAQALKACEACLAALGPEDRFGLLVFDDRVEAFRPALVEASRESREQARAFLSTVDACGGTELAAGLRAAADLLGRQGGDILAVTDGEVFGSEEVIGEARAAGIRVHCLGIGSASQDRFLALLARETGGVSRFLTPRERVDQQALELFASIGRPLATETAAELQGIPGGRIEPEPSKQVFGGTPLVVFGASDGPASGSLAVSWQAEGERRRLELPLEIARSGLGETLRLLRGARLITDLESRPEAERQGPLGRRAERRAEARLRRLSESYGLASRAMALVAVVERAGDQPGVLPATTVVPVGMPEDVAFGSYFLDLQKVTAKCVAAPPRRVRPGLYVAPARLSDEPEAIVAPDVLPARALCDAFDPLLELACEILPDGGLPGAGEEERALASLLALLWFLAEGHSERCGPYRKHVRRLVGFLAQAALSERARRIADEVLELARRGGSLPGDWKGLLATRPPAPELWDRIAEALAQQAGPSAASPGAAIQ